MIAALFDLHGNLPALDATLDDARAAGAERFLLGGDYAAFGAWPLETVGRLEALGDAATWIRGNWERWQAEPDGAPQTEVVQGAGAFAVAALGAARVERLAALPQTLATAGLRISHASPLGDMEAFAPAAGDDERVLAGAGERLQLGGHVHVQYARDGAGGIRIVNPGSVGLPWDGDRRAAYALIGPDLAVTLRRVAYDDERSAAALDAIGEPWSELTARRLRKARFDAL